MYYNILLNNNINNNNCRLIIYYLVYNIEIAYCYKESYLCFFIFLFVSTDDFTSFYLFPFLFLNNPVSYSLPVCLTAILPNCI